NVGRAADQHEAAVAVTAIDIAFFVDFHVDARMTERRSTGNIGCAVAGDAGSCNANGFGWLDHSAGFITGYLAAQDSRITAEGPRVSDCFSCASSPAIAGS